MSERALGLMSGTSLDGVSAALVEIDGPHAVKLLHFRSDPYPADERDRIRRGMQEGNARELALLNAWLGERFAKACVSLLEAAGVRAAELSFVASHGQTVWHEPRSATLQLGDPAVIAERLGVRVVSDFRSRDVAAGGEGAPLVPMADALLFGREDGGRALLNLGGIANVSWVPRLGQTAGLVAFDTGPGVAVIDAVARATDPAARFDDGGERAARGHPVDDAVGEALRHPFFAARPPKSTGREVFGDGFAAKLMELVRAKKPAASDDDCVATAVELTARSIAGQLGRWLEAPSGSEVLVSGGGARNPTLVARLRRALPAWSLRQFSDVFFDGEAKEAVAFALLGWLTLAGLPGNVPGATGARGSRVLGRITPA